MSKKLNIAIVGAGLGGIAAAISLRARGHHVTIYEKNDKIGGKLNTATIDGYTFDLGPSIMILPDIFRRLFQMHGKVMDDYFTIRRLEPQWRNFFEDGEIVDLHGDMAAMEQQLGRFPIEETAGYYAYLDYSRKLWKFAEEYYFKRRADKLEDVSQGLGLFEIVRKTDYFRSMADGVGKYISNHYLSYIMNFFIKYVGSSSYNAPAILNLLAYSQLGYGEWYVDGGMYNIALGFGRLMEEIGVKVNLGADVAEISTADGAASGIVLADGRQVPADYVVSNMETIPAYRDLLGHHDSFLESYEKKFEPSCSGIVVHLGLDREYPQLGHHNFFFAEDLKKHLDDVYNRKVMPTDPTIYLVAPTRTDKTIAPKGCEIIKILPHIPHIQDPPYTMDDYVALKERVYDKLERMGLKDLRKHIVVEDMLVPEDIRRMYRSNRGSIYGIVADRKKNKGFRAPKKSEKYDNLFFVGGSVNPGSGMPMVLYSGIMVGDMITDEIENTQA